jgi:hypothetical protein
MLIALLCLFGNAWAATYNIGLGETYTTFTLLSAHDYVREK